MGWVHLPVKVSPPFFLPLTLPPPPPQQNFDFNLDTKVRPSILLIIVVLAIIFFVSGLLHLLVRLLLSPPNRDPEEMDNVTALQGQLQQLFHLHDAGKFRNVDGGEGSSSSSNCNNDTDVRRCFSMGSFEYVMDENTLLQVPIRTPMKKQSSKKPSLPLTPGHRLAMSECGFDSRREFNGFDAIGSCRTNGSSSICANNGSAISSAKKDSLSVSKIWLQDKQSETEDSSRRAFSFRFPWRKSVDGVADEKGKNVNCGGSAFSEIDSELGCCDEENQSCNSLDSQAKTPSFARRTLLWLVGRQNKVVHSSYSSNI
ncbi:RING-H2 finger protein ATL13-like [Tripterygium wilfordii]|uniref:RING-type E3 ubiquitin transferase n=1 Tax=Tripterygium wilfordii TaxID=458696 RepID=A0A7J7DTI6_TRIWF|nr:RING-H2 finger protein ATL13-like [Tripterygium wilfordii]